MKTEIWTFGLRRDQEENWEMFNKPRKMVFENIFLEEIEFYKGSNFRRVDSIKSKMTLFLFHSEEEAVCFSEGFSYGQDIEANGDEIWEDMMNAWIDYNIDGKEE